MVQPTVFVAHGREDSAYCRDFVLALRQSLGSKEAVWYDTRRLPWGTLRREVEAELIGRQHFIAILSPRVIRQVWLLKMIGAAVQLWQRNSIFSIQYVKASRTAIPLMLGTFNGVDDSGGQPYPPAEAAAQALVVIRSFSPADEESPGPNKRALGANPSPIPPECFPGRLAELGFTAYSSGGVEYIVPPLCTVPAGSFLMGSDPDRDRYVRENEQPQHTVTSPAYEISRFPVTVAEYACFARAGYREPKDWQLQLRELDRPVVWVSSQDAEAYAAWLTKCSGQAWQLPSEAEWEKAARGPDGRIYPWGNTFDQVRCNLVSVAGILTLDSLTRTGHLPGSPAPVGGHPFGASPYGVQDMVANMWEWTRSRYQPYPLSVPDEDKAADPTELRAVHGRPGGLGVHAAHAACRDSSRPDTSSNMNGFRLVLQAPS